MAVIDLVGVPVPIGLPEFKNDAKLLRRIRQLESLIELKHDMEDAEEALRALRNSLKNKNQQSITSLFDCTPWKISECILSYIVVLYAKAFTKGTGRTRLDGHVNEIFEKDIDKHICTIELRNGFYAHQGIEANKHQLFCLPNVPSPGKVRLNPNGQTTRMLMPMSIDLGMIDFCISKVKEYLRVSIDGLCTCIENELTTEQLEILIKTPKEELMNKHWQENSENIINPFSKRKT